MLESLSVKLPEERLAAALGAAGLAEARTHRPAALSPPSPSRGPPGAPPAGRGAAQARPCRSSFLPSFLSSGRHLAVPACGSRPASRRSARRGTGGGGGAGLGRGRRWCLKKGTVLSGWACREARRDLSPSRRCGGAGLPACRGDAGGGRLRSPRCPPVLRARLLRALFFPQMKETIMNQEKLAKLQAQVRIGGKVGAAALRCRRDCASLSGLAQGVLETAVWSSPECSQLCWTVLKGICAPPGPPEVAFVGAVCSS